MTIYEGISVARCNSPSGGGGWQLRLGAGGAGRTKFFADGRHGGSDAAKLAAEEQRRAALAHPNFQPPQQVPSKHNTSGVRGVRFIWRSSRTGWAYLYVDVMWRTKNGMRRTCYSLNKNGAEGAIRMALAKRGYGPELVESSVQKLLALYSKVK